jgi:DNA-directed RNA polymerase specialized sigma subunit
MSDDNCIDTKIENALNNKDIMNIMSRACQPFSQQLEPEDIYTCKINALWKSFLNFNPDKNCKFTTYLYKGVYIECLKAIKFNNKSKKFCQMHSGFSEDYNSDITMIDLLDEAKDQLERELLIGKASRMTNQELGKKHGIGKETVRKKMKKITKKFQHKFS